MDETMPSTSSSTPGGSKMMVIVSIIIVLILLGIGGYYVMNKQTTKTSPATTMMPKPSPTSSSMFTSLQDALSRSLSLQCDYTDPQTGTKTTAYIKNGSVRADILAKTAAGTNSFIMKNKTIWFWTGKKGMTMAFDPATMMQSMPSVSPMAKPSGMMVPPPPAGAPNMMGDLEKIKENCKPATVADTLFIVPTDVVFTDLSKMMPSGGAMMPKVSGAPVVPSGMSQQQMQEYQKQMMQKYATPPPSTEK